MGGKKKKGYWKKTVDIKWFIEGEDLVLKQKQKHIISNEEKWVEIKIQKNNDKS